MCFLVAAAFLLCISNFDGLVWLDVRFQGCPKLDFLFQRLSLVGFGALRVYPETDSGVQKFLLGGFWLSGFILCWTLVFSGFPRWILDCKFYPKLYSRFQLLLLVEFWVSGFKLSWILDFSCFPWLDFGFHGLSYIYIGFWVSEVSLIWILGFLIYPN